MPYTIRHLVETQQNEFLLNVRSAPADSLSFHTMGKDLYISCSGEAESRIRKPASCFYDLKDVIDRLQPMSLCFAVEN